MKKTQVGEEGCGIPCTRTKSGDNTYTYEYMYIRMQSSSNGMLPFHQSLLIARHAPRNIWGEAGYIQRWPEISHTARGSTDLCVKQGVLLKLSQGSSPNRTEQTRPYEKILKKASGFVPLRKNEPHILSHSPGIIISSPLSFVLCQSNIVASIACQLATDTFIYTQPLTIPWYILPRQFPRLL